MNDELVKLMVERFLQWKLPDNFNPDGGISFKKMYNEHTSHPMKHEPVGTNLLDHEQAEQMVRYMLAGENAFDCHFSDIRPYLQHKRDCGKFRAKDDGPGLRLAFWDDKKPCTCGLAKLEEKYGRSK